MTNRTIASSIVRVALLPSSEWTDEDLAVVIRKSEADKPPEPWLIRGRARAMLAQVVEKVLDHGVNFTFPDDNEALEFSVSEERS